MGISSCIFIYFFVRKVDDKKYFKYLLHKETYIFKKSKNFKTLKNIIYLFLKTI